MSLPAEYWRSKDGRHVIFNCDCLALLPHLTGVDAVVTDPHFGASYAADTIGHKHSESWDDKPPSEYVLRYCQRFPCVLWGGNYFALPPSRGWLIWYKPDAPPSMADAELAWTSIDMNAQLLRCSIASTNPERVGHPTQKPIAVMAWSLGFVDGETILDPFMGSGTTGVACIRTGRRFIGCEIEPKYAAIAVERMERELAQPCLPTLEPQQAKQENLL